MPSRRRFLRRSAGAAALAPLAACAAPVAAARADGEAERPAWSRRLDGELRQATVREVNAYAVPRAVFVQVVADDGTEGWGEAGHDGGPFTAALVTRELRPIVVGRDVFDAEATWAAMYFEADELGPSGLIAQAIAGVDCALWDLRGKLLGRPVCDLIGGRFRETVPLYGSFTRGRYETPEAAAEKARELQAEGFRALKFRLNIREEGQDPLDDPAVPFMGAIRRAVGDGLPLYVDPNNGYSPSRAVRVGRRLADEFGVELVEEPVAAFQYPSLARVADALDIPVAGGEHEYTKWHFRDLILQGRVDVINPDVSKLAGLTEAKKVAALAEVFDTPISVHNARPTLLTAAHLHFVASSRMAHRLQEHPSRTRLRGLWDFFEDRFTVKPDGTIDVPTTPGLGLTPDARAIRAAAESL
jgi:L-alanine-DL-glutamate epimerase-like enolase superfamily enzyme